MVSRAGIDLGPVDNRRRPVEVEHPGPFVRITMVRSKVYR
jgi:hypothetical protein